MALHQLLVYNATAPLFKDTGLTPYLLSMSMHRKVSVFRRFPGYRDIAQKSHINLKTLINLKKVHRPEVCGLECFSTVLPAQKQRPQALHALILTHRTEVANRDFLSYADIALKENQPTRRTT